MRNKKNRMNRNVGASTETLAKTQSYENNEPPKTDVSPLRNNPYQSSDKKQSSQSRRNSNVVSASTSFDTKKALTGDDLLIEYAERITRVL